MTVDRIEERMISYSFYNPNKKIACVLRTYYGYHSGGIRSYAYKNEIIPIS